MDHQPFCSTVVDIPAHEGKSKRSAGHPHQWILAFHGPMCKTTKNGNIWTYRDACGLSLAWMAHKSPASGRSFAPARRFSACVGVGGEGAGRVRRSGMGVATAAASGRFPLQPALFFKKQAVAPPPPQFFAVLLLLSP